MNPGELWGQFRIIHFVGSGAMGEVYFARNEQDGREVAVKRVRRTPGPEGEEKISAERVGAELERRLCAVDTRVTKVFRHGEISGDLFIEMEFVDGEDLSTLLRRGPLLPGRAAVVARELCEMLENLRKFETGVIHGDLKPKNIRVDSQERVRVMDFGVAKALSQTRDHTEGLFGSIAYCSPERLDSGSMDQHSDLWSVGVMLYQMLSGNLPFEGETPERLERRVRSDAPPAPLPASCPQPLNNIVFKMLAREQTQRYPSAMAMRDDLERFLRGADVQASDATVRTVRDAAGDPSATQRTARPVSTVPGSTAPTSHARGFTLRHVAAFAVTILVGGALLVWLLVRPQYQAWADARELKREIETEHMDPLAASDRYQSILGRKRLGFVTWGVGGPLKSALMSAGEIPILDFRNNDYPTSREAQWKRSVTYFSRALEIDPGDKNVKAKLRLCEGHLLRIRAGGATRQQMLNDAAQKFQEASELMHKLPDPYIGLARLYAFNLGDCDRAREALERAAKLGHAETRRERATLADAYLRRAQQEVRDASKFQGMPESAQDYLKHARDDYSQARDLYSQLASFANAPEGQIAAVRGLADVDNHLIEINVKNP